MKRIVFIIIVLLLAQRLHAEEIAVIVNESGPLTGIAERDVRDIYLGHMRFLEGVKLEPLNYREGPVKDAFLHSIVGKTSREYRRYWTRKSFKEGLTAPYSQRNVNQIISSVRSITGAIGYIPATELHDMEGVTIITTIDKK
jgi:ABC-type phosphate transport system substrate-binding protein